MIKKAIIIGGSAGSFMIVSKLLSQIPADYKMPVFLCLHRLKYIRSGFIETLSLRSNLEIIEPYDKEHIRPGKAYLAPSNYHMYIESGNIISLSADDPVNHSRPSIDLSFITAAKTYREGLVGIILSGANRDGAYGLKRIKETGGTTIIQSPDEAEVKTMPISAQKVTKVDYIYDSNNMIAFLKNNNK